VAQILIVEDDHDLNNAYCIILKNEGHEVVTSYNGKEALGKLKGFAPELILLDLLMPIMGGLEFLKRYNSLRDHGDAKILIFTNMENSPEVAQAYKLGVQRCIIKSWTAPHNLARVISDTLQAKTAETTA
jgi:CheY-like chemotaxis protein